MAEYIPKEAFLKETEHMARWGLAFYAFREAILDFPAADVVEVGSCDRCHWKGKGRFQKCTYCRRNKNMKDHYLEEGTFNE